MRVLLGLLVGVGLGWIVVLVIEAAICLYHLFKDY